MEAGFAVGRYHELRTGDFLIRNLYPVPHRAPRRTAETSAFCQSRPRIGLPERDVCGGRIAGLEVTHQTLEEILQPTALALTNL